MIIKINKYRKVPVLFMVVLVFTYLAGYLNVKLFGFNMSGWGWIVPTLFSFFILCIRFSKITFPVGIWLPWMILLTIYLLLSDSEVLDDRVSPIQRTIQLAAPLFVGMAASTYRFHPVVLERCVSLLRRFSYVLFASVVLGYLGAILAGLPTGLAAQVMTNMLLSVFFISRYLLLRENKDLFVIALNAAVPVFAITRTVIFTTISAFPLSFAPIRLKTRLQWIGLASIIGFIIFYLPQVQHKMFYSGQGKLSDISSDNMDIRTTGRSYLWEFIYGEAIKKPWFGHGTGAGETFAYRLSPVGYPHNDWLLTFTDYGILGVVIFIIVNITMILACLRSARQTTYPEIRTFFIASASTFIPFFAVMYTDNIMVYASFFGILQYTIIGLAFGALKSEFIIFKMNK